MGCEALREAPNKTREQEDETGDNIKCPICQISSPESEWKDNKGYCPQCKDSPLQSLLFWVKKAKSKIGGESR